MPDRETKDNVRELFPQDLSELLEAQSKLFNEITNPVFFCGSRDDQFWSLIRKANELLRDHLKDDKKNLGIYLYMTRMLMVFLNDRDLIIHSRFEHFADQYRCPSHEQ